MNVISGVFSFNYQNTNQVAEFHDIINKYQSVIISAYEIILKADSIIEINEMI